jgi:hypothetical protein
MTCGKTIIDKEYLERAFVEVVLDRGRNLQSFIHTPFEFELFPQFLAQFFINGFYKVSHLPRHPPSEGAAYARIAVDWKPLARSP